LPGRAPENGVPAKIRLAKLMYYLVRTRQRKTEQAATPGKAPVAC
jgi:hypothetical protein